MARGNKPLRVESTKKSPGFKLNEVPDKSRHQKHDVHGVRKDNIRLKERLKKAEKKVADQVGTVRNTSRDYVRTMDDNTAMRVGGHQPLPARAELQRRMIGDGTNPFMRY